MNKGNTAKQTVELSAVRILLMGLAAALFCANLPAASTELSSLVLLVFAYGMAKLCQNKLLVALVAVPTGGILLIPPVEMLDSLIYLASILFGTLAAIAVGGIMLGGKKRDVAVYIASLAVAFIGVFAYTRNIYAACATLVTLPSAAALAICDKKKMRRVPCLCAVSAAFLLSILAPAVIVLASTHGTDTLNFIGTSVESFRLSVNDKLIEMGAMLGKPYSELYSPKSADALTRLTFDVLPALAIVSGNIIAFFSQTCYFALKDKFVRKVKASERVLIMSKTSAWMFVISLALTFITSFFEEAPMQIFSVAMTNLNMILTPAFFVIAAFTLIALLQSRKSKLSLFTIILIVFALVNFGSYLMYPLSIFGAITVLRLPSSPPQSGTSDKNS